MAERKRIGYIHEFHANFDQKSWIANEDLDSDDPTVKKDVQGWLFGLNEPCSQNAISYLVHQNNHTELEKRHDEEWAAEYHSTFYDGMKSVAIAYGRTPEEAIINVRTMVMTLIEKYYVADLDLESNASSIEDDKKALVHKGVSDLATKVMQHIFKWHQYYTPIISNDIEVISKLLNVEEAEINKAIGELLDLGFISCSRNIRPMNVLQYQPTDTGRLYLQEKNRAIENRCVGTD